MSLALRIILIFLRTGIYNILQMSKATPINKPHYTLHVSKKIRLKQHIWLWMLPSQVFFELVIFLRRPWQSFPRAFLRTCWQCSSGKSSSFTPGPCSSRLWRSMSYALVILWPRSGMLWMRQIPGSTEIVAMVDLPRRSIVLLHAPEFAWCRPRNLISLITWHDWRGNPKIVSAQATTIWLPRHRLWMTDYKPTWNSCMV